MSADVVAGVIGVIERRVAYRRAASEIASPVFLTRDGKESGAIASRLDRAQNPRISPDGRSLALVVAGELWKYDLDGRPPVKLTFDGALSPIWSRDGQRIAYEGGGTLRAVAADGSGKPEDVAPKGHFHPHSFTPDSREIVAVQLVDGGRNSAHSYESDRRKPLLSTIAEGGFSAALSPDGRWLAYLAETTAHRKSGFAHIRDLARRFACLPMAGRNQCGQRTDASCTTAGQVHDGRRCRHRERLQLQAGRAAVRDVARPNQSASLVRCHAPMAASSCSNRTRPRHEPITVILNWTEMLRSAASR